MLVMSEHDTEQLNQKTTLRHPKGKMHARGKKINKFQRQEAAQQQSRPKQLLNSRVERDNEGGARTMWMHSSDFIQTRNTEISQMLVFKMVLSNNQSQCLKH